MATLELSRIQMSGELGEVSWWCNSIGAGLGLGQICQEIIVGGPKKTKIISWRSGPL